MTTATDAETFLKGVVDKYEQKMEEMENM